MTKSRAVLELIFAGALWGFGFIATKWALDSYSVYEVLSYRFLIATLVGEFILFLIFLKNKAKTTDKNHSDASMNKSQNSLYIFKNLLQDLKITFWGGLLMAFFIIPQTIGLETTTATKSGFLTVLYILLVPLIQHLFLKVEMPLKVYGAVLLGLLGVALLVDLFKEKSLVIGDAWTLACALFAAFHILYVGKVAGKSRSPFRFNNFQSLWCFLFLLPLLLSQKQIQFHSENNLAQFGVFFMAIGSSLLAFTAQVRAQQVLSSTTASMLFLLESPFALLFGFFLLSETLNAYQLCGAVLILISSVLVVRWEAEPLSSTKTKPQ